MSGRWVAWAAALAATVASGQDRPSEGSLFGGPDPAAPAPAERRPEPPAPPPAAEGADRPGDAALLSGPPSESRFDTREEKEDPLKVGGTLYLRAAATGAEGDAPGGVHLTAPSLMDGYFDARPSDRVRGMMLARLQYDPTQPAEQPVSPFGLPGGPTIANPRVALDQLWIRFDVARTVFVTAGKQHVKWGASRFWNPTDFLTPTRKDPLAAFDTRLGATMLKAHLPWEAKGWNFYGIGLFDNSGPAATLGQLGGAARAEVVVGMTEAGIDAVVVGGRRPRYGLDLSSALGPVDVYGEVALRSAADFQVWKLTRDVSWKNPIDAVSAIESDNKQGLVAQASGGVTFTFNYTDKNALTVGAEYFYNPVGASTPALYPWLLYQNQFQPFYAGQHYAAIYALAAGLPGNLTNVTLTLSTLGNLSDRSFVTRVDSFIRVLSYLSVELYAAGHYGQKGGELRFALDVPALNFGPGQTTPAVQVPAPVAEGGIGLRVSL